MRLCNHPPCRRCRVRHTLAGPHCTRCKELLTEDLCPTCVANGDTETPWLALALICGVPLAFMFTWLILLYLWS